MTDNSRPQNLKGWLRLFFSGLCMGTADLVPGVSGGTMALILGIYESFIRSLCTLDKESLDDFIRLRWREFFKKVEWQFLCALGLGMLAAIFTLAPLFHFLLNNVTYRSYLYAFFMGLVLASSYFCGQRIRRWPVKVTSAFGLGALIAAVVTLAPLLFSFQISGPESFIGLIIWMFFCGLLGVCAMLLPGISGSYVLTILQAYPIIIGALAALSSGVVHLTVPTDSLLIILSLGAGIALGALFFSRFIRWLLTNFHDVTLACMVGFMLGALPAVWPFWGEMSAGEVTTACMWMIAGGLVVVMVEKISQPVTSLT